MPEAHALNPSLMIQAAGAADIGRVRPHNEDAVLVRPDLQLYVVADGAGGHNGGNVASALAIASVANHFESTDRAFRSAPDVDRFGIAAGARRLSSAIRKANHDIVEISKSSKNYGGMGSTVVALTIAREAPVLHVGHVGDSRCYRLRNGRLEQLTHDHSLLNDVVEMHPDIGDDALAKLPRKVVTRALGMEEVVRATVRSYDIAADDIYLLCSDGLTGELPDERIRRVLSLPEPPADLVDHLIRLANESGGGDNIAAVVVSFGFTWADVGHRDTSPSIEFSRFEPSRPVELPRPIEPAPPRTPAPPPRLTVPGPPPMPPPPRESFVSAPEILLLGIESQVDPEEVAANDGSSKSPAFRVVPEGSADSGLIDALSGLLHRRPRNTLISCGSCGELLPPEAAFCPRCGIQRADP
jgi:PPM family protein phosphatase